MPSITRDDIVSKYLNSYVCCRFEVAQFLFLGKGDFKASAGDLTCLVSFTSPTSDGDFFSATFKCPSIKFACEHEIFLSIQIEKGDIRSPELNREKHRYVCVLADDLYQLRITALLQTARRYPSNSLQHALLL